MPDAASLCMFIGAIVGAAGAVGCFVAVYRENEDLAFFAYLINVVFLIAIFRYWRVTKKPFFIMLVGWILVAAGWLLGGSLENIAGLV